MAVIWADIYFFCEKKKKSDLTLIIKFSASHLKIVKMTGKKRTIRNKEPRDEVGTASKFSGSDTEIEENADITEVDEDYCTINDQIVQTCNFDYRLDQASETAETNRKETDKTNKDQEKKQGNTHLPFSCPSETVSAPALNTQVVSTAELQQVMREMASSIV